MSLIEQVVFEQRPGKSGITTPGKGTANEEVIKEDCTTVFKSIKESSVVETVERGGGTRLEMQWEVSSFKALQALSALGFTPHDLVGLRENTH